MCSQCGEDHDPACNYCGKNCAGRCDDPDVCPSCWGFENGAMDWAFGDEDEASDECMMDDCRCKCHAEFYEEMGLRFEGGVRYDEEDDGPTYERKGAFPFLQLPGEIRDRIYRFSFLQEGEQREHPAAKHRGRIHTNFLLTVSTIPATISSYIMSSTIFRPTHPCPMSLIAAQECLSLLRLVPASVSRSGHLAYVSQPAIFYCTHLCSRFLRIPADAYASKPCD